MSRQFLQEKILSHKLKSLKEISLTGGEPFLHIDIKELVLDIISCYQNIRIGITTNGTCMQRVFDCLHSWSRLKTNFGLSLSISLGGYGKAHDFNQNLSGLFNEIIKSFSKLEEFFQGDRRFCGHISHTITERSREGDIRKLYDLAKEHNFSFSTRLYSNSPFYCHLKPKDFCIPKNLRNDLNYIILHESNPLLISFFKGIGLYENQRDYNCYSGTYSAYIDIHGNVFPCINLFKPFGNLYKESFEAIWKSKKAQIIQNEIKKRKCACWTECETLHTLYHHHINEEKIGNAD